MPCSVAKKRKTTKKTTVSAVLLPSNLAFLLQGDGGDVL